MRACMRILAPPALLVALTAGCGPTTPPNGGPGPGAGGKSGNAPKPLGDAVFKLSSRDFVGEFKKDGKAAHMKYKGKTVEVTGVLWAVGSDPVGDPVIFIESEPKKVEFMTALMAERYPGKLMAPGQTVTVKGRVLPDFPRAHLLDAEVVKVEGEKAQAFTADTLQAEFAKGHDAAAKKHENKWVTLSGEIEKVELNDVKAATVVLKTTGKGPRVAARFSADERRNTAFKSGQKIEVIGQLSPLTVDEKEVGLFTAELIAAPK